MRHRPQRRVRTDIRWLAAFLALLVPLAVILPGCSDDWVCGDDFWRRASVEDVQINLDFCASVYEEYGYGLTPMHVAAAFNENPEVVELIIERGADINAKNSYNGMTPLHWAARGNENPKIVELLIDSGANINAKSDSGQTPCDVAGGALDGTDVLRRLCAPD